MTISAIGRTINSRQRHLEGNGKLPPSLAELIHRQNMRRYKYELWTATNPARRALLLSLIAAEDARADAEGWVPRPD